MDDQSSQTSSQIDTQTSQQKNGGHHLAEGTAPMSGPTFPFGSEDAPSGVSIQRSGEEQLKTSQQLRGEHKKLDSTY